MAEPLLMGIDIGTQGTKTALFRADGQPVAESFEPSRLISPRPGEVTQDPDEIFLSVVRTIRSVLEQAGAMPGAMPGAIAGIGLSGQMAGILGIADDGTATTPYDSWLDTRCEPYIARIRAEAEQAVVAATGCPVTYAHGPKILWWQHERPDVYARTARFVEPTTYVALRLSGQGAAAAYIDYTQVHFSGFAEVEALRWSDSLLRQFGIAARKMPDIIPPWQVVGSISTDAAAATGLAVGTPIVAGCGDQAATSLGAGIVRPGQMLDVSGTACLLSVCTEFFAPDLASRTLLYARSVLPGLWIPLAYSGGSGLCLKWFADSLARNQTGGLKALDELAARVPPGSDRLVFVPHFAGRTCPNNPDVRGSYVGLTWSHGQGHLYRAILESIGYEYRLYLQTIGRLLGSLPDGDVRVIGGGSKSSLFSQIKADILGRDYWTLNRHDGAALGSALLAGHGTGLFPDLAAAVRPMVRTERRIEPDPASHAFYQPLADLYEEIIEQLAPVYRKLALAGAPPVQRPPVRD